MLAIIRAAVMILVVIIVASILTSVSLIRTTNLWLWSLSSLVWFFAYGASALLLGDLSRKLQGGQVFPVTLPSARRLVFLGTLVLVVSFAYMAVMEVVPESVEGVIKIAFAVSWVGLAGFFLWTVYTSFDDLATLFAKTGKGLVEASTRSSPLASGTSAVELSSAETDPVEAEVSAVAACGGCGTEVSAGAAFCASCGRPVAN